MRRTSIHSPSQNYEPTQRNEAYGQDAHTGAMWIPDSVFER
jgi:hypothetical protein